MNLLELAKSTKHKLLTFRITDIDFTRTVGITNKLGCKRSDLLREIFSRGLESVERDVIKMK